MATWEELLRRQHSQKIITAECTVARPDGEGGLETTVLRLSSRALNPALCEHFWRPCLKGLPSLSQAIREPMTGQSQVSYGELKVVIGDGRLDSYLNDWQLTGQPMTLRLGFPELAVEDFQPIFVGRMGKWRHNDRVLTVPIQDSQADLLSCTLADGEYSGDLPTVVQTCLAAAGITDIDADAWDLWAAENDFAVWIKGNERVSYLLDNLLAPLACWYTFDRFGRFVVGTFKAPTEDDPQLRLVGDARLLSYDREVWEKHYWKIALKYLTQTSPSPDYGTLTQEDSTIKTLNRLADDIERETCLTLQADAQVVLDRLWALFSTARRVHTVTVKVEPLALGLHGQMGLSRNRFGLSGNFRAMSLDGDLVRQRAKVGLFQ